MSSDERRREGEGDEAAERLQPGDRLTYGSYLKVSELLSLQELVSETQAHDELLFITIHQAYELWFKQILFELDSAMVAMGVDDVYEASRLVARVLAIENLLVKQIHILETMTPRDFLSFRKILNPASGFQSVQFRELEFLSGIKDAALARAVYMNDDERERVRQRLEQKSLRTAFYEMLRRLDFNVIVPADGEPLESDDEAQTYAELGKIYSAPEKYHHIYTLAERLVAHDQNLLLWRFHHVRVVERLIGTKRGTGGSAGVRYLNSTLGKRAFPMLWEVRGMLSDEHLYGTRRGRTETREGNWEAMFDDAIVRNDE